MERRNCKHGMKRHGGAWTGRGIKCRRVRGLMKLPESIMFVALNRDRAEFTDTPCTKSAEMKKRTGPSGGSDNLTPNERRRKMIIKIQKRMRARETIAYMMKMIGIMHDGRSAGRLKRMFR